MTKTLVVLTPKVYLMLKGVAIWKRGGSRSTAEKLKIFFLFGKYHRIYF